LGPRRRRQRVARRRLGTVRGGFHSPGRPAPLSRPRPSQGTGALHAFFRSGRALPEPPGKEQGGMRLPVLLSAVAAGIGIASAPAADPDELVYVPNSTTKVCQLTGDFDRALQKPTLSQTGKRFGVVATDL